MDSQLGHTPQGLASSLFQWSRLESGRVRVQDASQGIRYFAELQAIIERSFARPVVGQEILVSEPITLTEPTTLSKRRTQRVTPPLRSLQDEAIIQKLLAYRNQKPLSARVVRPEPETSPAQSS